ncbi:type II toxin-antitoxin system PemK/MazF family toxin [Faecalimonas umbilicata]|uniref:type II toxin-antitoxin system PemK/MazF family toxin n=1 Tax=Faecalimonas umbilicata TaxID=1912855 RepID=UPI00206C0AAA|nr:type II toxin-antitoxin system PemK/MazF family toxin [Faecalimonas umbilicata]DAZ70100.1 MAG TPA: PemK-like protein [Caudoviricetes sp.]
MGRKISKDDLLVHKEEAILKFSSYLDSLIESDDFKLMGKADKLSYWLKDWSSFLGFESDFSANSLRRYKRGEIIKAHLGFNVGSEEGGLHYCVVLDRNNSKNSPIVTVVPLTSVKSKTDLNHLHLGNIYIGNELFTNLTSKISYTEKFLSSRVIDLKERISALSNDAFEEESQQITSSLEECHRDLDLIKRMKFEVNKMKIGSIALVCQIRTISKMRIYDPKTNFDILSGVKLSSEKLDLIDHEILQSFTGYR